jgi:hypothetical protein
MTGSGPIPLASGPMPGEAVVSWVSRVAADTPDRSCSPACAEGSSSDRAEDIAAEALLARATRLDRSRIGAMRLVTEAATNPAVWHRQSLAWCPACVRDDVARHGETYERAAWRIGCCVACPTHQQITTDLGSHRQADIMSVLAGTTPAPARRCGAST